MWPKKSFLQEKKSVQLAGTVSASEVGREPRNVVGVSERAGGALKVTAVPLF